MGTVQPWRGTPFMGHKPGSQQPGLTEREKTLLRLLVHGHTNEQIAAQVFRSEKTVRNQFTRIFEKLGAANRTQAAALFLHLDQQGAR
jgi:DNA-binding NarL/FixJ family response regulator